MLNTLHLQSEQLEDPNHPRSIEAVLRHLTKMTRSGLVNAIVTEGRPGVGKTIFTDALVNRFKSLRIPYVRVGMDSTVLPRGERNGHSVFDYCDDGLLREVYGIMHRGGGSLKASNLYSSLTGKRDHNEVFEIPSEKDGVLICEGVTGIRSLRNIVSEGHSDRESRTQYILLDEKEELANRRRFLRDTLVKGLSPKKVAERITKQGSSIRDYYEDLKSKFTSSSNVI